MESPRADLSCGFRSHPQTCGFQKALPERETEEESEPRKEEGKRGAREGDKESKV